MSTHEVVLYLVSVFLAAMSPGPTVVSVAATAANRSVETLAAMIVGIEASNIVLIGASGTLRVAGLSLQPALRHWLSVGGAVALVLIGTRLAASAAATLLVSKKRHWNLRTTLQSAPLSIDLRVEPTEMTAVGRTIGPKSAFTTGFLIHTSNPNTIVFYSSVFLAIVPLGPGYFRHVVFLGGYALFVDALMLTIYAGIGRFLAEGVAPPSGKYPWLFATPALAGAGLVTLGTHALLRLLR